jgi:hypothetical protein
VGIWILDLAAHLWIRRERDAERPGLNKLRAHHRLRKGAHWLWLRCWRRRRAFRNDLRARGARRAERREARSKLHVWFRASSVAVFFTDDIIINHAEVAVQLKRSGALSCTTERWTAPISTPTSAIEARQH